MEAITAEITVGPVLASTISGLVMHAANEPNTKLEVFEQVKAGPATTIRFQLRGPDRRLKTFQSAINQVMLRMLDIAERRTGLLDLAVA